LIPVESANIHNWTFGCSFARRASGTVVVADAPARRAGAPPAARKAA
jgi:hypothetical protein